MDTGSIISYNIPEQLITLDPDMQVHALMGSERMFMNRVVSGIETLCGWVGEI